MFETILNFALGLVGLGVIILIHELGHLLCAKLFRIDVEVFSVGFGPKLFRYKGKRVTYCLSLIPLGGYCKMKGSDTLNALMQQRPDVSEKDLENTFYRAAPWKRILVLFAGPFANLTWAFVCFFFISSIGLPVQTFSNRVVLVSDSDDVEYAADRAGIQSGDSIESVAGIPTKYFDTIASVVRQRPDSATPVTVRRGVETHSLLVYPSKDEATGSGMIGVFPWIEPVLGSVIEGSDADIAGLSAGDRILSVDGKDISHALELNDHLRDSLQSNVELKYERRGNRYTTTLYYTGEEALGMQYQYLVYVDRVSSLPEALLRSFTSISDIIVSSFQGIGMMFSGTPLSEVIAGPIQIVYIVGSVSTSAGDSLSGGLPTQLLHYLNLIAIISVAVAFMNLLPIPIADGGQILISVYELVRRKALPIRAQYYYHLIGFLLIMFILVIALLGDVSFLRGGLR